MNIHPMNSVNQTGVHGWHLQERYFDSREDAGKLRFSLAQGETGGGRRGGGLSPSGRAGTLNSFSSSPSSAQGVTRVKPADASGARAFAVLLGNLAAQAHDEQAKAETINELAQLIKQSKGELANLPGGARAVAAYLRELKDADLFALYAVTLDRPDVANALLDQLDSGMREQAARVLHQMVEALNRQLIQSVLPERLSQIAKLPSIRLADAQKLEAMLTLLRSRRLDDAKDALSRITNGSEKQQALSKLDCLHQSLEREIDKRAAVSLTRVELALLQAVNADKPFAASMALCDLSSLVWCIEQAHGSLSKELADDVRKLVNHSLPVFRDPTSNPDGPLSEASLRRLNPDTLDNLRLASSLHRLGLELEEAADAG